MRSINVASSASAFQLLTRLRYRSPICGTFRPTNLLETFERCFQFLAGVAAMSTTLVFFLIAVLLMLAIITDSFWRHYQR